MNIKYIKLHPDAVTPTYASAGSAGADLYSLPGTEVVIPSGETVFIHTGLAMELPEGYCALIFARSGLATKRGLAPANKVGVVDSDYRGEFMVALYNQSSETQTVGGGERIAQMVIVPYVRGEFELTDGLTDTDRGSGGFGSTGK